LFGCIPLRRVSVNRCYDLNLHFRLCAHRFQFLAIESVYFPPDKAGNVLRGALLATLEPGDPAPLRPSGLADPPPPFVLRAAHLNGRRFEPGESFAFDLHIFDLRAPLVDRFARVCAEWESTGLGPRRGRVQLLRSAGTGSKIAIDLSDVNPASNCSVYFRTPTTLKGTPTPDGIPFGILFARVRDRIATLSSLYGEGPPVIDFGAIATRAALVRTVHSDLRRHNVDRLSSRTGAVHGIGGVTGSVDYEGDLTEFLPWLRAAFWTGIGRHTVWGNGVIEVVTR
jgi:hypothetical protein